MTAILLASVLSLTQAPEGIPLGEQLEDDFEELVEQERNPDLLHKAARLLARDSADPGSRWLQDAVQILKRTRSRAGIPLLLKHMLKHAERPSGATIVPACADALASLTGEDIANPYERNRDGGKAVRAAVEELVKTWWLPAKDKITTDLRKMSPEQVRRLTDRLLWAPAEQMRRRYSGRERWVPGLAEFVLRAVLVPGWDHEHITNEERVHPTMLPALLAAAGRLDPGEMKPVGARATPPLRFEVVPLLAALRQDGEASSLDKVARDAKQNSAIRLVCMLALYRAGEDLPTEALLSLLEAENDPERRLIAILALEYCREQRLTTPCLVALLDDTNGRARTAAVCALRSSAAKQALPKLKKILDEFHPHEAIPIALTVVANMRTREAQATLALFLQKALAKGPGSYLSESLSAFETATGRSWVETGASRDEAYYRAKAEEALKWWKTQK